jgi:hypothetical protein
MASQHHHQYNAHHRPPTPHPISTNNLQLPGVPHNNTPITPTSNMSSSSSSSDFENFLQLQKPTIRYHPNQLPVPSSSPMALNTTTPPAVQMSQIPPQMIDQTNYIQRGDISGHWATYFSGPNYLKVHSFMGQPVVGPTVPPPPPPVHQAIPHPAPPCYRTPANAYPPVAYPPSGR